MEPHSASRTPQSTHGGVPPSIMKFYERVLRSTIARPLFVAIGSILVIALAIGGYALLGSDLPPAKDEGGFIVDYIIPAGAAPAGNKPVHPQNAQNLRSEPEVHSTSRRNDPPRR